MDDATSGARASRRRHFSRTAAGAAHSFPKIIIVCFFKRFRSRLRSCHTIRRCQSAPRQRQAACLSLRRWRTPTLPLSALERNGSGGMGGKEGTQPAARIKREERGRGLGLQAKISGEKRRLTTSTFLPSLPPTQARTAGRGRSAAAPICRTTIRPDWCRTGRLAGPPARLRG